MSYYWDVIRCFSINVTIIMCPTQELVGVMTMIEYQLIVVGKTVLAYPSIRSTLDKTEIKKKHTIMLNQLKNQIKQKLNCKKLE